MNMKKIAALALLSFSLTSPSAAAEFTKGTVQKVDTKAKKLTIKHEELVSLDMPAMTMVFVVADPAMLEKAKEGQTVQFVAERIRGKLTVVEMK